MSTRSMIGICYTDGSVQAIYCHYDGYVKFNGAILHEYYSDNKKARALVGLGDISCLREKIEPDPSKPHSFENAQDNVVVAYHRDRGEQLHCEIYESVSKYLNANKDSMIEYLYLFDENVGLWYVADLCKKPPRWKNLAFEIDRIKKEEEENKKAMTGGEVMPA